jgi:hypothetical protein
MKGFRTPSWFRSKEQLKEKRVKAQTDQPKRKQPRKGK